jgi:hypothetical protein
VERNGKVREDGLISERRRVGRWRSQDGYRAGNVAFERVR